MLQRIRTASRTSIALLVLSATLAAQAPGRSAPPADLDAWVAVSPATDFSFDFQDLLLKPVREAPELP